MTPSEWYAWFVRGFVTDASDINRAWKHYLDWYRTRDLQGQVISDRAWTTLMGEFLFRLSLSLYPDAIQVFEEGRNDFVWRDRTSWEPLVHIEYENDSKYPETLRSETARLSQGRANLGVLITYDGGDDAHRERIQHVVKDELRRLNFDRPFVLIVGGLLDDSADWKGFEYLDGDWTQIERQS